MSNPIEDAVNPLKVDAVAKARTWAVDVVAKLTAELEANNMDSRLVAPYPKSTSPKFHVELVKYKTLSFITEWDYVAQPGSRTMNGPCIVKVDAERVAKFIKEAEEDAAAQYVAFVKKLVSKIGDCVTATLHGNHVWDSSILLVTKTTGVECWKTQSIINVSKLGKFFQQWPTRKMKG